MTTLKLTTYKAGGTLCVLAVTDDGPPFPISINLHDHPSTDLDGLGNGEFVLGHSYLSLLDELLEAGLAEDTGKRCSYAYVTNAPILRLASMVYIRPSDGMVYNLRLYHGMPYDSYGAVTAAAMDGDAEGLAKLLEICPREYRGRCDAMNTAASNGDLAVLKVILPFHDGEENIALRRAVDAGHAEAARLIRERMAELGRPEVTR